MEPEGSLPHLQEPATCSSPELDQSSPSSHPTSRRSVSWFIILTKPSVKQINVMAKIFLFYTSKMFALEKLYVFPSSTMLHNFVNLEQVALCHSILENS